METANASLREAILGIKSGLTHLLTLVRGSCTVDTHTHTHAHTHTHTHTSSHTHTHTHTHRGAFGHACDRTCSLLTWSGRERVSSKVPIRNDS